MLTTPANAGRGPAPGGRPDRGQRRPRRAVLAVHRGAGAARRARPALGPPPFPRPPGLACPAERDGRPGRRGRGADRRLRRPGHRPARPRVAAAPRPWPPASACPARPASVTKVGPRSKFLGAARSTERGRVHGAGRVRPVSPAASGPLRTSCRAVAHIGDSTSDGLVSPDYLPNPAERITARYEDVGVRTVRIDISGGRSVVEVLPGQVNGYRRAPRTWSGRASGAAGSSPWAPTTPPTWPSGSEVGLATRIARMMSAASGEPVLWVNIRTLVSSGPYAEPNMARCRPAPCCGPAPGTRTCGSSTGPRWPGASGSSRDGIHYTSAGVRGPGPADRGRPGQGVPAGRPQPGLRGQVDRPAGRPVGRQVVVR